MKPLPNTPNAHYVGKLYGKRVYKFVVATMVRDNRTSKSYTLDVTAHTAADAVHYAHQRCLDIVAHMLPDSVESVTFGPRGGIIERYAGIETLIGHAMLHGTAGQRGDRSQLEILPHE